jgi:hypothetical protein
MIYVITYTNRRGHVGFLGGGRHTTKSDAERTLAELREWAEEAGRSNLTIRRFKNMTEACNWRDSNRTTAPLVSSRWANGEWVG